MGTVSGHQLSTFSSPVNGTSPIDANTVRGNDNTIKTSYNAHDADVTIHLQSGVVASRPAASTANQTWLATDTGAVYLYLDTGSAWVEANYLRNTGGTVSGNVTVTGTLESDGDFSVNTSKFTVTAASGNTSVAGTLGVTGLATLSGGATVASGKTLTLTGATVAGAPTWSNGQTFPSLTVSGSSSLATASLSSGSTTVALSVTGTALGGTGFEIDNTNASSRGGYTAYKQGGSYRGFVGVSGAILGTTGTSLALQAYTGQPIDFYTNGSSSAGATLSTGNALTVANGLTVSANGITVVAGGASITGNITVSSGILTLTGTTGGASAGDMVIGAGQYIRSTNGGVTQAMIGMDANGVTQLGVSLKLAAVPQTTGVAASANYKGVIYVDTGIAGQLVFFDGVTGARYKLTGTAF